MRSLVDTHPLKVRSKLGHDVADDLREVSHVLETRHEDVVDGAERGAHGMCAALRRVEAKRLERHAHEACQVREPVALRLVMNPPPLAHEVIGG